MSSWHAVRVLGVGLAKSTRSPEVGVGRGTVTEGSSLPQARSSKQTKACRSSGKTTGVERAPLSGKQQPSSNGWI